MKIYLIDGTFELFRAYYAGIPGKSPSGQDVGATRGFLRSMIRLIKAGQPCHLAVAFDHVIESFRNDLFEGYKTGEGMDPVLHDQFALAEAGIRALGITLWSMKEFEADDALATGAVRYSQDPAVDQVILCTPDKDMAQVVRGDRVVMWDRIRDTWLDEDGVWKKFGVGPASIPDLLALVGDKADGVPGIPRWGMKSAAGLLATWESLDKIPPDPDQWQVKVRGAAGLSRTLEEHRSDAGLYKTLTTLRLDVPLAESPADLRWRGPAPEWAGFCEQLGDTRLQEAPPPAE